MNGYRTVVAIWLIGLASCTSGPSRPPPSFVLFVFDTARLDAVSAYGKVAGTTPVTDALAAAGLRYARAYASSSWTLPSHASLFTGLLPSHHGVSWQRTWAPDALVMLAERLHDAGYETVGVSENPWVSEAFNMTQGFESFTDVTLGSPHRASTVLADWVHERRTDRPFFLFVNVIDPHAPYKVRAANPFLPPGVGAEAARRVSQEPKEYLCRTAPHERELSILHGLYLGGVAAADVQLGNVLRLLREARLDRNLVTIVTSDHGEHFGEHRLVSHAVGVREPLIHVPLVVHGVPGVAPAVIQQPVQLTALMPTVLNWAGVPGREGSAGRLLPTRADASDSHRTAVAEWYDPAGEHVPDRDEGISFQRFRLGVLDKKRCRPEDRVFGRMRALVKYPLKLIWYANYPAQLYDLSTDPEERHDLAPARPSVVAALSEELESRLGAGTPPTEGEPEGTAAPVSKDVLDQLRALGYMGGEGEGGARPLPR